MAMTERHGPTTGFGLIDWDNVNPLRIDSDLDAEHAVSEVIDSVAPPILDAYPTLQALELRLYGSWKWSEGNDTRFRVMVSRAAAAATRRVRGCVVAPIPVSSLAVQVEHNHGTPLVPFLRSGRCRCPHRGQVNEQKLADTMIVSDAIYYSIFADVAVVVVSDDVDMLPGVLVAANFNQAVQDPGDPNVGWHRPTLPPISDCARVFRFV